MTYDTIYIDETGRWGEVGWVSGASWRVKPKSELVLLGLFDDELRSSGDVSASKETDAALDI